MLTVHTAHFSLSPSGGPFCQCATWIGPMYGGPWQRAWHCGYCGDSSQPAGGGVSVCLHSYLTGLHADCMDGFMVIQLKLVWDGQMYKWDIAEFMDWWKDNQKDRTACTEHRSVVAIQHAKSNLEFFFYKLYWKLQNLHNLYLQQINSFKYFQLFPPLLSFMSERKTLCIFRYRLTRIKTFSKGSLYD